MMDRATIIGLAVAGYGALLSTVNSIIQVIAHHRDRVDVIVSVRKNLKTDIPRYANMTLTLVTATNRGKRPVSIQGFSIRVIDSKQEFLPQDIRPPLPCLLSESQSVTAFVDEEKRADRIESYYAWDSVGRYFYRYMAPWHRRILSRIRRRLKKVR